VTDPTNFGLPEIRISGFVQHTLGGNQSGEFNDHWNISGDPSNLHWSKTTPIPFIDPSTFAADANDHVIGGNSRCISAAGGAVEQLASGRHGSDAARSWGFRQHAP